MAVSEIKKIHIFAYNTWKEKILEELQNLGVVQIIDGEELEKGEVNLADGEEKLSQIKYVIDYLSNFEPKKKGMIESFLGMKHILTENEFQGIIKDSNYKKIYEECRQLEKKNYELNNLKDKLVTQYKEISPWRALTLPLEKVGETNFTQTILGMIPTLAKEKLWEEIKDKEVYCEVINEREKKTYFLLTYWKQNEEEIGAFLKKYVFEQVSLPQVYGMPAEILARLKKEITKIEKEKGKIKNESENKISEKIKLLALYEHFFNLKERRNTQSNLSNTAQTFVLNGWIKKKEINFLKEKLDKISQEIEVQVTEPGKDEEVPVDLENKPPVRPFEMVTNLYGLPKRAEVDPTPFLAPFFMLFFAFCLTDAGYGLILIFLSFLLIKKLDLKGGGKKLLFLLIAGGSLTIIAGLLTGGWLGNLVDYLPFSFLKGARDKLMIIDPLKNPLPLFIFSLFLGVVQVLFGLFIKMIYNIREKKIWDALYDEGCWILFLVSLIIRFTLKNPFIISLATKIVIITACILVVTQGRKHKNILKRLGLGVLSLYRTMNFLADVLSYSRLFALGLATAGLAMVINTLAFMVKGTPYLGFFLMMIILVGGHLANVIINTLGAFIHTSRLQFVEFFSKFFEGGGNRFIPFKKELKYLSIRG